MNNGHELIKELMNIGLNLNESKVYLTLIKRNVCTVSEIANESAIPRVKVYGVLKILMKKGFCSFLPGKIIKYKAEAPKFVLINYVNNLYNEFQETEKASKGLEKLLQPIFDNGLKEDHPSDYIKIIKENKQISNIFVSLEKNSDKEILLFVKSPIVVDNLDKGSFNFEKIKAVCEKCELKNKIIVSFLNKIISKNGEVRITDKIPVKMAIFDRKISMVNIKDYSHEEFLTTTVIDHSDYADLLVESFLRVWERSVEYTKKKSMN
ncbi:MAG: hypothetical protein KKD38_05710 [Candidatus Delongbacteria bacterium]|nr:hypothetical protein [Candidatus Delongbacteria bacterium]